MDIINTARFIHIKDKVEVRMKSTCLVGIVHNDIRSSSLINNMQILEKFLKLTKMNMKITIIKDPSGYSDNEYDLVIYVLPTPTPRIIETIKFDQYRATARMCKHVVIAYLHFNVKAPVLPPYAINVVELRKEVQRLKSVDLLKLIGAVQVLYWGVIPYNPTIPDYLYMDDEAQINNINLKRVIQYINQACETSHKT